MTKNGFNKKYNKEIANICKANNVDLAVGADMFLSNIKAAFNCCYEAAGELCKFEIYAGLPATYNYKHAAIDWLKVI